MSTKNGGAGARFFEHPRKRQFDYTTVPEVMEGIRRFSHKITEIKYINLNSIEECIAYQL